MRTGLYWKQYGLLFLHNFIHIYDSLDLLIIYIINGTNIDSFNLLILTYSHTGFHVLMFS